MNNILDRTELSFSSTERNFTFLVVELNAVKIEKSENSVFCRETE